MSVGVTIVTDPMSKLCCYWRLINHGSSYCVASKFKIKNGANTLMMLGCMMFTVAVSAIEDAMLP